ncbi:MAG: FkbM family methyltransferase [Bdellovibrionales bacterium]
MDLSKKLWLNLFARKRFGRFNASLLRRAQAGLGVNDYGPRQNAGERRLLEDMVRDLPQNAVVCDVGAHNGSYATFLASRRPDLVIHAFEPNPTVFSELKAKAANRFTAHNFALGEREGEAMLHDPKSEGGSECASLVAEAVDTLYGEHKKQVVPVRIETLDSVALAHGLKRIDYLKIDAEGYDLMVLRGAQSLIRENRLGIVQFEFNKMNVFSRTFMHDFHQILPNHNLHRIVQDGLIPLGKYNPLSWEIFGYQNIVGLPRKESV